MVACNRAILPPPLPEHGSHCGKCSLGSPASRAALSRATECLHVSCLGCLAYGTGRVRHTASSTQFFSLVPEALNGLSRLNS